MDLAAVILFFKRPETSGLIRRRENGDVGIDDFIRLNNAHNLFELKMQISAGISRALASYLYVLRAFGATDGRDRVYALLGLIKNPQHPLILPNYTKTDDEVFADAARYILTVEDSEHRMTVLALSRIGQYYSLQKAPLWVPNWSSTSRKWTSDAIMTSRAAADRVVDTDDPVENPTLCQLTPTFGGWRYTNSLLTAPLRGPPGPETIYHHYSSSMDTHPQFSLSPNSNVLQILGFVVDEVAEMSSVMDYNPNSSGCTPLTEVATRCTLWLTEVDRIIAKARHTYPSGKPSFDVLWRTLIGNQIVD